MFTHKIDVRFRDCDALGHVNNSVYLTYLEQTRLHYWRALWGFGSAQSTAPGVIMARAEIDYRRPGTTSFTYSYDITNEDGALVASARTVQVMYDYAQSKPVPIPTDIRAKMQII